MKGNGTIEDFYINSSREDFAKLVDYGLKEYKKRHGYDLAAKRPAIQSLVAEILLESNGIGVPNNDGFGPWSTNVLYTVFDLNSHGYKNTIENIITDFITWHNASVIEEVCHAGGYTHGKLSKEERKRLKEFFIKVQDVNSISD